VLPRSARRAVGGAVRGGLVAVAACRAAQGARTRSAGRARACVRACVGVSVVVCACACTCACACKCARVSECVRARGLHAIVCAGVHARAGTRKCIHACACACAWKGRGREGPQGLTRLPAGRAARRRRPRAVSPTRQLEQYPPATVRGRGCLRACSCARAGAAVGNGQGVYGPSGHAGPAHRARRQAGKRATLSPGGNGATGCGAVGAAGGTRARPDCATRCATRRRASRCVQRAGIACTGQLAQPALHCAISKR
jgi:hypothetical protein